MKRKSLLILLLLALLVPWAAKAQITRLSENFNSMSDFANAYSATGWYAYNAGSGNNWTLSSTDGTSSSKCAKYGFNSSNAADCYLVSSPFDVSAGMTELTVSLQEKVASATWTEKFEVFFVKASDVTDNASITTATKYIVLSEQTYSNTSYAEATNSVTDAALAGQSVRVVVHCTSDKDKYNLFIDDILVTETSSLPSILLAPNSATVITGSTQTLTATLINVTGTPAITYTSSNDGVATVSGSGTTATVTGVVPGTATITATMNYEGENYTATCAVTVEDPSYCQPSFSSNWDGLYITSFTTSAGINNSTEFSNGGYGDYYDTHAAAIEPGETLSFTVGPDPSYGCGFAIWVDWNKDYEFSSDERVAATTATTTTSWSGSFTVASSTPVGDYRMRVLMQYSSASPSNPCVSASYGEGEDYKLSVVAPSDCPRTNSLTAQATGDQAVLSWTSTATAWQVCVNNDEDNLIEVTENPYTLENLTLSTDYTVKVRANCSASGDGYGDWSNDASFTTGICTADDMCAITYTLTDAYDDGWNGNKMEVRNSSTNELIATWTLSSGGSTTGTLLVCEGITLDFVYVASGNYQYENGWTITDINEEIISTHEGCYSSSGCDAPTAGIIATYTVNCTVPTCIKPTMNATATNIKATEATVSWTAGNEGQEHWDVYYCTGTATAPTASTEPQVKYTSDNPLTLTGLQAEETYYVWVRGNCGTEEEPDYSDWSNAYCTFTTTKYCADMEVVYSSIEFTEYTSSGVTVSWTAAGGATQWRVQVYDLQTSPYELKDTQVVTAPTAVIDGLQSERGYQVDIAPYCAEADDYTPTVSKLFSTLDDCPSPTDLAANDVTASSASISWTNNGLTEFNLRYSCDQTVTWIDKPNVTSPCSIDELPANTKIYVQVQGTCDATNDRWEEMTFFTACGAFTVDADNDFSENFDTDFPNCWSNPVENINNQDRFWNRSTSYNNTEGGTGSVWSNGYYGPIYLIMPDLDIADYKTDVKLTFWSYNRFVNSYDKNSVVLLNGSEETELWSPTSVSEEWVDATVNLSAYKGQTIRLAFKFEGNNAHCWYVDDVKVAFDPTCMPVGTLADATEVKATSAKLSWALIDDTQDLWEVQYCPSPVWVEHLITSVEANTNNDFLLEGLTPDLDYWVRVRANCGSEDGYGEWSNVITFSTLEECFAPYEITASNLTSVSADLTWTGESDSYNIEYWEKAEPNVILEEGFEGSTSMPSGWDNSIHDNLAYYWNIGAGSGYYNSPVSTAANGSNYNANYFNSTAGEAAWLISPAVNLEGFTQATLTFNYVNPGWYGGRYNLIVYYRIGEGGWQQLESYTEEQNSWIEKSITLTTDLAANYQIGFYVTGYDGDYGYGVGIDDVKISTPAVPGEVQNATSDTEALTLENLEAGKTYEVKVQGVCGGTESEWSLVSEFTTLAEGNKVFVTEGNWNEADNWLPTGAPALTDDVIIRANATIPGDCVALANDITIETGNQLVINDGGQLLHSNVGVYATMQKVVEPYEEAEGIDKYVLLASPMQPTVFAEAVENLLPLWYENAPATFNVDFYKFDQNEDLEWVNLENTSEFQITNGEGYLYAHNWQSSVTLSFNDALMYSGTPKAIDLVYTEGKSFAGWNLIGNPFPCNATVSNAADPAATFNYYKINAAGEFVTADGTVAPMEGIFALATEAGQEATFTRVVPGENSIAPTDGILNVNLMSNEAATRKGNSRIDMARLRFGQGNKLGKLNLFGSNATVFFPQDGKDYGVMYAEAQGEMPLHFKAEKNGTYTLGFTTEDVSFGYLHLIDNMTGTDVDLLATPSYTFDARTTDYASRFRLVFSANGTNGDDNFGFIDAAGNLVITDATAGATLQIIDVMGRVVRSTDAARHISTNGMAPGVYMLRLINGTNVKVQKIVVK
ncbi:MAG: choice-of-anchor J domain-containing protein [Bacteroidales bacterium]|nr:choice-of-anchor J domain-containing protein [Bacteroidales bacterium]